jgi:hypothetical protein
MGVKKRMQVSLIQDWSYWAKSQIIHVMYVQDWGQSKKSSSHALGLPALVPRWTILSWLCWWMNSPLLSLHLSGNTRSALSLLLLSDNTLQTVIWRLQALGTGTERSVLSLEGRHTSYQKFATVAGNHVITKTWCSPPSKTVTYLWQLTSLTVLGCRWL